MATTPITPVRLDPTLKAQAVKAAAANGETLSDFLRTAIARELDARKPKAKRAR